MNALFEQLNSPETMMDAEDRIIALGGDAIPLLATLFDGSSRNEWDVPYRSLGLPLRCALEIAARLGPIAKPLEAYIAAELSHANAEPAAQALGVLGDLAPASITALIDALQSDGLIALEAASALVRCGADRSSLVERAAKASASVSDRLERVRRRVRA